MEGMQGSSNLVSDMQKFLLTSNVEAGNNLGIKMNNSRINELREGGKISESVRSTFIFIDRSPSIWDLRWHRPSYNVTNISINPSAPAPVSEVEAKRKDEKSSSENAVKLGALITVVSTVIFFYYYPRAKAQVNVLSKTRELEARVKSSNDLVGSVKKVFSEFIEKQLAIDTLKANKVRYYMLAAGIMLAGGLTLASGGILMSPILMTAGKLAILPSLIIAIGNCMMHLNDKQVLDGYYREITGDGSSNSGLADKVFSEIADKQRATACSPPSAGVAAVPSAPPVSEDYTSYNNTVIESYQVLPNDQMLANDIACGFYKGK